jgi:hypothetical protein
LALGNAELLSLERYPEQGEQALRHAKFVRDTFLAKERPTLILQ